MKIVNRKINYLQFILLLGLLTALFTVWYAFFPDLYVFIGVTMAILLSLTSLFSSLINIKETLGRKAELIIKIGLDDTSTGKIVSILHIIKLGKDPIFISRLIWGAYNKIHASIALLDGSSKIRLQEEGEIYHKVFDDPYFGGADYIFVIDTLGKGFHVDEKQINEMKKKYEALISQRPRIRDKYPSS